jgi:hypothetical protein
MAVVILLAGNARAEERLRDIDGAPAGLALHPWLEYSLLDHTHASVQPFNPLLPVDVNSIDLVVVNWPRSEQTCRLAIVQHGVSLDGAGPPHTLLMIHAGEAEPGLLALPDTTGDAGVLARLCIWPTSRDGNAELVFLGAFSTQNHDSKLFGFKLTSSGELVYLDVGGALTLYGWFDVIDLDSDGSFELVTSRNLDGTWGGFSYRSVRGYNGTGYSAAPESYPDYFRAELARINWIVDTRAKIQDNPMEYVNQSGIGPYYIAEFKDTRYGFDSIIELPTTALGIENVPAYNAACRAAFQLIVNYRDELTAWLDGGDLPATWKLAQ